MIDIKKKYRTRSGKEVVIYTYEHPSNYPIVGSVGTDVMLWDKDGFYKVDRSESQFDLIEEPKQYTIEILSSSQVLLTCAWIECWS
jgi:hypothetical protein